MLYIGMRKPEMKYAALIMSRARPPLAIGAINRPKPQADATAIVLPRPSLSVIPKISPRHQYAPFAKLITSNYLL